MIPTSRYMAGPFLARRRNRRWIVAFYWCFLVPATAFTVGRFFSRHFTPFLYPVAVLLVLNLWTFTRSLTKPFGRPPFPPDREALLLSKGSIQTKEILADFQFDEREARERDHVHFEAYRFVLWFSFAWFAVFALVQFIRPQWSMWLGPVFMSLFVALIAGLPQTMVLWNAPDVEAPQ